LLLEFTCAEPRRLLLCFEKMIWRTKNRDFDLACGSLVMGIVNVTLDSFSDGGNCLDPRQAVETALRMAADGADIIDIGGESTRPGATPIDADEEMARVLPVIWKLHSESKCAISIDTYKPQVAEAALQAGAEIINDITGLRDPAMLALAATSRAAVVLMHMQGDPQTMQQAPHYEDITREIREFFRQSFDRAITCGMTREQIALDPGIGFGKTASHNLALIKHIAALRIEDRPLLLGASRKSFLAHLTGATELSQRLAPTLAVTALASSFGVNIFRVHDVPENVRALKIAQAILSAP
jgi:dihydropteroate synthase